jgi:DNA invertase Pin-like site-specific DNA recombinase
MKVYGYCRVSTTSQQEDGVSLSHQEARITAWATANGHELAGMFVETGSGSSADDRPELQKAMQAVCKAKGVLCVASLSRFSRSVVDTLNLTAQLDKADAHLASLSESIDTSSAVGRMVFKMLSTLNEFERDVLAERTRNALGHMRRQQKRISGPIPYGYTLAADGETLLPVASEQGIIHRIAHRRAKGQTLAAIAASLTSDGIGTKTPGKMWHGSTVASILKRQQLLAA